MKDVCARLSIVLVIISPPPMEKRAIQTCVDSCNLNLNYESANAYISKIYIISQIFYASILCGTDNVRITFLCGNFQRIAMISEITLMLIDITIFGHKLEN